jgi:hypothetical protein
LLPDVGFQNPNRLGIGLGAEEIAGGAVGAELPERFQGQDAVAPAPQRLVNAFQETVQMFRLVFGQPASTMISSVYRASLVRILSQWSRSGSREMRIPDFRSLRSDPSRIRPPDGSDLRTGFEAVRDGIPRRFEKFGAETGAGAGKPLSLTRLFGFEHIVILGQLEPGLAHKPQGEELENLDMTEVSRRFEKPAGRPKDLVGMKSGTTASTRLKNVRSLLRATRISWMASVPPNAQALRKCSEKRPDRLLKSLFQLCGIGISSPLGAAARHPERSGCGFRDQVSGRSTAFRALRKDLTIFLEQSLISSPTD